MDGDRFLAGLRGVGEVAIFLHERSDGDYGISPAGTALGQLKSGGQLTFPAMAGQGDRFAAGVGTVEELNALARSESGRG